MIDKTIGTILEQKMDNISNRLDRENSLYLAHSEQFKEMIYLFLEQLEIVYEQNKLKEQISKEINRDKNKKLNKEYDKKQKQLYESMKKNKKNILVFADDITIRIFGYFTNLKDFMQYMKWSDEKQTKILLIMRGFLIGSLRIGLNFDREDRISSILMLELNDYFIAVHPYDREYETLTKELSKELEFEIKW